MGRRTEEPLAADSGVYIAIPNAYWCLQLVVLHFVCVAMLIGVVVPGIALVIV